MKNSALKTPLKRSANVEKAVLTERFYRPELDSLRFLAFLLVFLFHVYQGLVRAATSFMLPARLAIDVAGGGAAGVDLFFILSAYLITELLMREKEATGIVDVQGFYVRRILRIWPLYFVFVFFCFLLQFLTPSEFPLRGLMYFLILLGNWYCMGGFMKSPVGVLWSVSIEEQFYLLWPLFVRGASRRAMILLAGGLVVGSQFVRWYMLAHGFQRAAVSCCTFSRVDGIGIGILLATVLRRRVPRLSPPVRILLLLTGLTLFGLSAGYFNAIDSIQSVTDGLMSSLCGVLGSTALFVAFLGAPEDGVNWLASRTLTYLGGISYGLYVFHLLYLDFAKLLLLKLSGTCDPQVRLLVALPLTLLTAALSYRWFESPFLRMKRRFTHITSRPTVEG